MSNRTRGLSNKMIGQRAAPMKDSHGKTRFVYVAVGEKFATVLTGSQEGTCDRGSHEYEVLKNWVNPKQLGKP